ncbi:hypothetical protein JFT60_27890 [Pseudomonas sp. MF6772]|jgi:hypothetical protein|uniref:hypothetical protein n=1 Tax=Pseudomonas TaxID=286 RepID=UPI00070B476C|nr:MULTISPECIES: hypothetical protein [Pseudomonas]SUD45127.1 Uncharacterised protein [Pseudomonas fluorescens]MBJ2271203.1 hypothetical protein [Pseudomonas sp. MF6772]MBL7231867.1 hypothetical protein [Pseudomonas sp.]MCU0209417.1 hypothetical protein [Pseudomonas shahriarae]NMY24011.1 hypothetical protein [Pseudomonas sp. WS 5410]
MKHFAETVIAIAPVKTRKSRNRFFRKYDRWTDRLLRLGLIDLEERQDLRQHIAGAYLATLM